MARVESDVIVDVPVRTAYNQWTQFEEFPRFMEGVESVQQLDDRRLHWKADFAGRTHEWDAEIREQVPDQKIIWQSTDGAKNAGIVMFEPVGATQTKIHLEMSYEPDGVLEEIGTFFGALSGKVEDDLENFKEFIESRGAETGGWRGEIDNPHAPGGHTAGTPRD